MNPVQRGQVVQFQFARRGDVGQHHALLDHPVRIVARIQQHALDVFGFIDVELRLGRVEVQRAALASRGVQDLVHVHQGQQAFEHRADLAPRFRTRLKQGRMGEVIGQPRGRAHDRRVEARALERATLADLHVGHEAEAIDMRLQRAELVGQRRRQHRHDPLREVHRGTTLPRVVIQRRAFAHVMTDVGDGHDQAEAAFDGLGINGVVKVLGIFAVDGDQRHRTQIEAPGGLFRIDAAAIGLGFAHGIGRKGLRQVEPRNGGLGGQRNRTFGVETTFYLGGTDFPISGVIQHARDDPVAMARAAEVFRWHHAIEGKPAIGGMHAGIAAVDFDSGQKGLDAPFQQLLDTAGPALVAALLGRDPHAIAVHQPGHFSGWQEDVVDHAFDPDKPEAGTVRTDAPFHDLGIARTCCTRLAMTAAKLCRTLAGRTTFLGYSFFHCCNGTPDEK